MINLLKKIACLKINNKLWKEIYNNKIKTKMFYQQK